MITRHVSKLISQSLQLFPAVLLIGARQVGKSTLAKQLVEQQLMSEYVTLDILANLEAARHDPDGFIAGYKDGVVLDEIQRVPDLMRALKKTIDQDRRPGRFLLTGSANVLAYPEVQESLAGRVDIIHLEGLSLGELYQQPHHSPLIADLLDCESVADFMQCCRDRLNTLPQINRESLLNNIFFGGFPDINLKKDLFYSERWYSAYQTSYIERDVRDISKLVDIIPFSKVLQLTALRTGNLLVTSHIANEANIDYRTVMRYLGMLELTFQTNQLVPWHANAKKRLVKTPKIYCNDSGFAAYLCGIESTNQLAKSPFLGALVETWLWAELRKLITFLSGVQTLFYRAHLGNEVDFVLMKADKIIGIELKWADSVSSGDFKGLQDLQKTTKKRVLGVVLYSGDNVVPFGKYFTAIPLRLLL